MGDMNIRQGLLSGQEIENLPSFGVGSLLSSADGANNILETIRNGQANTRGVVSRARGALGVGSTVMAPPVKDENEATVEIYVSEADQQELDEYGFKFAAGTEPIGTTTDMSQIMESSDTEVEQGGPTEPTLRVRIMTPYMRFRYMSEKTSQKKKGGKSRQYEPVGDDEKHCLAEVWVDNYTGSIKIVAFCVDVDGKLHPYNLFGEKCHNGVYVKMEHCRPGKKFKLNRVTVTTPKEKEYKENLKNQLKYLSEVGIHDVKFCEEVKDKQIVYIMFRAILIGNKPELCLDHISTPIQNKKKGKEFRIEDIEPVWAPAAGKLNCNIQKYRVIMYVTEETNFPTEVGVKIREKNRHGEIVWETEPDKENIKVIRQCVVWFIPPPYKNPQTKQDVEVEVCLFDKTTKIETEPVKFTYVASVLDDRSLENKTQKKRKLDEDVQPPSNFQPDKVVVSQRKILSAIRKGHTPSNSRSSNGSPSDESETSTEEQVQYLQIEEGVDMTTEIVQALAASSSDPTVNLQDQGNSHLPFSSYSENQNLSHSGFGTSHSQPLQQPTRPQSAGFTHSQPTFSQANQNTAYTGSQNPIVTSTTTVFSTTQQTENLNSYSSAPIVSVNQQSTLWEQETESLDLNAVFLNSEDMTLCVQQGVPLPKLGPNQSLALVNGRIFIVNDDISEPSTSAALPAIYQPPSVVQNIGNQQVIVQHIPPQQPSAEAAPPATTSTTKAYLMPSRGNSQNYSRSAPMMTASSSPQQHQQQQPQHQQQLQEQQLRQLLQQQIFGRLGIDASSMSEEQKQQLLQQIAILQLQTSQQPSQTAAASNQQTQQSLEDSDLETDGDAHVDSEETNQIVSYSAKNVSERSSELTNKRLKSNNTNIRRDKLRQKVTVENQPASSQIPTLIYYNREDGSAGKHKEKRQDGKCIDYRFQNGSFGDKDASGDEED